MRPMSNKAGALTLALTLVFGAASLVSAPRPAPAFVVYCTNCSTVFAQELQYAKEVETAVNTAQQLETEIQQYENMLLQGLSLPESLFSPLISSIQKIQRLYNQSKALAGNLASFDSQFRAQFQGGYDTYLAKIGQNPDYVQSFYKQWAQQGLDSSRTAMEVAGANVNAIPGEDQTLTTLVNQSQSAQGRLQAIQAGNQIAAQEVQQMQKLREMMNAQIQNESLYYAQKIQRQAVDDAAAASWSTPAVQQSAVKGY
jgi:P-type conjugative transfer protein TrbJ